jgi:hypothetical protein
MPAYLQITQMIICESSLRISLLITSRTEIICTGRFRMFLIIEAMSVRELSGLGEGCSDAESSQTEGSWRRIGVCGTSGVLVVFLFRDLAVFLSGPFLSSLQQIF